MNEKTQQLLISALVERVMALETWRDNKEKEKLIDENTDFYSRNVRRNL